ncbi:MAG TPA: hypothetical protein VI757_07990 [Bacteroidia bacterium]|nr:hypothetical protein [Bacteroidia bacterium]
MSKTKSKELDVDFIGGLGSLTKEEEKAISEFLKARKLARAKKHTRLTSSTLRKKVSA